MNQNEPKWCKTTQKDLQRNKTDKNEQKQDITRQNDPRQAKMSQRQT